MKKEFEQQLNNIDALSFDKLLSVSGIMKRGVMCGSHCCIIEVNTGIDRDIFKYPVRIDAYILVVCSNGLLELTYNLNHMTLTANSMFLYTPGAILRLNALEPSVLSVMVFTQKLIDSLAIKLDNIPLQCKIVQEHQIFPLTSQSCHEIGSIMRLMVDFVGMNNTNAYYNEMLRSLFKSFIYRILYEQNEQYDKSSASEFLATQENTHFGKFMRLLQDNYKRHHHIQFYSDKMGLTPKYLSLMIKKISGRLATEWIDDYVILEAKNLIKYSCMSIQEISYALNFPNQSFFGKYFKRHTGLSPKAYRQQQ